MSEQIKKGDLVMIVKPTPCCSNVNSIGKVFNVVDIKSGFSMCTWCGRQEASKPYALTGNRKDAVLLSRLKKLNPPEREESRDTTKELEVV